jgi:hypothetical protein
MMQKRDVKLIEKQKSVFDAAFKIKSQPQKIGQARTVFNGGTGTSL